MPVGKRGRRQAAKVAAIKVGGASMDASGSDCNVSVAGGLLHEAFALNLASSLD